MARTGIRLSDKLSLQRLIDEVVDLRRGLEKSGRNTLDAREMQQFIACDLGFHALLMSLANNSRLQKIVSETRLLIRIFAIRREGHDRSALKKIQRYHQNILDSVVRRQPETAMAILAEHIQASQRERLDEYDRRRGESALRESVPVFRDSHKTARRA